jgi:hypothetical protein
MIRCSKTGLGSFPNADIDQAGGGVHSGFSEAKRELGVVDFHDLEQYALRLLWDPKLASPSQSRTSGDSAFVSYSSMSTRTLMPHKTRSWSASAVPAVMRTDSWWAT